MAWKLDNIDFRDYGVGVKKASGVLDMPKMVDESTDWLDANGRDFWQEGTEVRYQDREITLDCWIKANSYTDFKSALNTFYAALKGTGKRQLLAPYITTAIECYWQKEVAMDRKLPYNSTLQIGFFTLRFTVPGDTKYKNLTIYTEAGAVRGVFPYDDSFKVQKKLQSDSYATLELETNTIPDIHRHDYILLSISGVQEKYCLDKEPEVRKRSTNKYDTSLRFEHESYKLKRAQFMVLGNTESDYHGTMEAMLDLIIASANAEFTGLFVKGALATTEAANHHYSSENCWQILSRLAEEYELEFGFKFVSGQIRIDVVEQIGNTNAIELEYGKGNGLYELTRDAVNTEELATVLYAWGEDRNLPLGYEYTRLRCPTFPLESNVSTFGRYAVTKFFEVKPERTGTVTSFSFTDTPDEISKAKYIVEDTSIDFDLNDYLLGGITAKISFLTGYLAGFEFEIEKYDNDTKKIYLIPLKDERGKFYPNGTEKPVGGDTYKLVDIDMPAEYLTTANANLLAQAQAWQSENNTPKVTYRGIVHPALWGFEPTFNGYDIGDLVPVTDTDFAISGNRRISELTYNVYLGGFDLILSDSRPITYREKVNQQINNIERTLEAVPIDKTEWIRKMAIPVGELKNDFFDPVDDTLRADIRIRSNSIDPKALAYDAGIPQFYLKNALVECNVGGDFDKVQVSAGKIAITNWEENTLDRWGITKKPRADYDPTRTWDIEATEFNLASAAGHFLYAKVDLSEDSTACTLEVFDEHKEVKLDIDDGFLKYKLGFISDSSSPRYAEMLWGNIKYLSPSALEGKIITQVAHGFTGQHPIRHNGTIWVKAQADNDTNAQTGAFVDQIYDEDHFSYKSEGFLDSEGWTAGVEYFLSPTTAGEAIEEPESWTPGQVRQSLGWGTPEGLKIEIDVGDLIGEEILEGAVISGKSITGNGSVESPLELVNDEETPDVSQYYGTNPAGAKGYHDLPESGSGASAPANVTSTSGNTDDGANHTHALDNKVTAGSASFSSINVDAKGRITAFSSGDVAGLAGIALVGAHTISTGTASVATILKAGRYSPYCGCFYDVVYYNSSNVVIDHFCGTIAYWSNATPKNHRTVLVAHTNPQISTIEIVYVSGNYLSFNINFTGVPTVGHLRYIVSYAYF